MSLALDHLSRGRSDTAAGRKKREMSKVRVPVEAQRDVIAARLRRYWTSSRVEKNVELMFVVGIDCEQD